MKFSFNFSSPESNFLLKFIPLILIWFFSYFYIYKIDSLLNLNINFLTEFSKLLSSQSNFILSIFNLNTTIEIHGDMVVTKILDYPYSHGVWIGEPCNGIKVFGVFTIFIIAFKGKIINKIWFIPLGILILHVLNILRISVLTYLSATNPFILDFNHNITFQLIIYAAILCLWYNWIIKFSSFKMK